MHILIIGTGSIGERHLRNFLRIQGVTCSIAEPNSAMREKISSDYSVRQAFESWEQADLRALDGVVICTPTDTHVPIMTALAEQGVNVLCEKPLATSLDGVPELRARIEAGSAVGAVAFCYRHDPVIADMRRIVQDRELGGILAADYYSGQYWPEMRKGWPPAYAQKRETGGGAVPDHLVHTINFLEWFFGPVQAVSAFQRNMALTDIGTEDYGSVMLRFAGGQIAQLSVCLFQRDYVARLQLVGEQGTVRMDAGDETYSVFRTDTRAWLPGAVRAVDRDEVFRLQAQHFIDCIRGKAEPRCTVAQAEQTLRVVLAAMESSDTDGRFVAL